MTPPAPSGLTARAYQRIEQRERIIEAALETVAKEGIDRLSMNRLAKSLGFTPGALYRYFDSKAVLIAEIAARSLEVAGDRLAEGAVRVQTPLAQVLALAGVWTRFASDDPHRYALLASMAGDPRVLVEDDDAARRVMAEMVNALAPLRDALERAATQGLLPPGDAQERTLLLFSALQGVLQLRKQARVAPELIEPVVLEQRMVWTVLLGFGASEDDLFRAGAETFDASLGLPPAGDG